MAKKYAFLFPGQGAQTQGMVQDICNASKNAKSCLSRLSDAAGEDIAKLLWDTDEKTLSRSDRSQLAITAASLIIVSALEEMDIRPAATAGFSLGEFPALCVSGVLSFADTIKVVKRRGEVMQEVCDKIAEKSAGRAPGMAAVLGLPPEKVIEIAASVGDVYAANLNSVKQTVVSGTFEGLEKAEKAFTEAGARRVVRLAVAGPYHCPLMQDAATEFEKVIANIEFNNPKIALFSNVTGKAATDGGEIKKNAVLHLLQSVRWMDEEDALGEHMKNDGAQWQILETGPGKVLSGLWKDSAHGEMWTVSPCSTSGLIAVL
ncbi:MAG: ACP S-malonyltransferase [Treponemataceae bacterium]|nr:MAG: ACP S-malonyltransferase [Treponemataceae bacterium]